METFQAVPLRYRGSITALNLKTPAQNLTDKCSTGNSQKFVHVASRAPEGQSIHFSTFFKMFHERKAWDFCTNSILTLF